MIRHLLTLCLLRMFADHSLSSREREREGERTIHISIYSFFFFSLHFFFFSNGQICCDLAQMRVFSYLYFFLQTYDTLKVFHSAVYFKWFDGALLKINVFYPEIWSKGILRSHPVQTYKHGSAVRTVRSSPLGSRRPTLLHIHLRHQGLFLSISLWSLKVCL